MRGWLAILFALVAAAPSAEASLLLGGFATDLPGSEGDDAFDVLNTGPDVVALDHVTVTSGRGVLGFPAGSLLPPGAHARGALNTTAYAAAARRAPDYALDAVDASRRLVAVQGSFRLGQEGDSLELRLDGRAVDAVVWGSATYEGSGWTGPSVPVAGRTLLRWYARDGTRDTDQAADWQGPSAIRLGWRDHDVPRFFVAGDGIAYTAPDQSRHVVEGLVARANESLRINVYEFRDVGLVRTVLDRLAVRPAIRVTVLVDEAPVGQDASERLVAHRALQELRDAGAEVRLLRHDRYAYDHAKYVVADDRFSLVQSENFVASGIPADARTGNRGWGILVDDRGVAASLARLFDDDATLDPYGAREPSPDEATDVPLPAAVDRSPDPVLGTASASGFNLTLLAGPESNLAEDDAVLATIRAATSTIVAEHLEMPPYWKDASGRRLPNLYLEALVDAARRGVSVRILLDGHFLGDPDDNAATVNDVLKRASGLSLDARILGSGDPMVLHVKGLVVDERVSLVGSTNWNLNSVAQNRELSVLADAPAFAHLYATAFEADWGRAPHTSEPSPAPRLDGAWPAATVLSLAFVAWTLRRRSPP